jgi:DNA-binding IscR family transcriptional regulator
LIATAPIVGGVVGPLGPNGGYRLARPAKAITLLNVVEAVDGSIEAVFDGSAFAEMLARRLRAVLDRSAAEVRRSLERVTIAQLASVR